MKISVAYITKPRGLRGELAAVLFRPTSRSLKRGLRITLKKEDNRQEFVIDNIKSLRGRIGLKLEGINSEEEASVWTGADVLMDRERLEPLDNDEFYHFQIEGAEVCDPKGAPIGVVKHLAEFPGNHVMIVETEDKEVMIPFVKAIVKSIDVDGKRIVISAIEGLL
jgi:16S rRNA processing protein RimM